MQAEHTVFFGLDERSSRMTVAEYFAKFSWEPVRSDPNTQNAETFFSFLDGDD